MKQFCFFLLFIFLSCSVFSQKDELQVKKYLTEKLASPSPEKIWFFQCKYKPGKTWQYLVACINTTTNEKPVTTLLFAERIQDTVLAIEPFYFTSVESFDHINMDRSKDNIDELYITTFKDSGNLDEKYTGVYSCKDGFVDTLIKFHSFEYETLRAPWFVYEAGKIVEQEDLCKLTDINGDGRIDISNRVHRKIATKDPGTDNFIFNHETDYAEYTLVKGRFVKMKTTKEAPTVVE